MDTHQYKGFTITVRDPEGPARENTTHWLKKAHKTRVDVLNPNNPRVVALFRTDNIDAAKRWVDTHFGPDA